MSKQVKEDRLNAFFASLTADLTVAGNVSQHSRHRLLTRMRKRALFVNPTLGPDAAYKFLMTNFAMKNYRHRLANDVVIEASRFITRALENYTTSVHEYNIQVPLDYTVLMSLWRFGPKSSYGCDGTHPAEKIDEPMSCTSLNEPYVKRLRASNIYFRANDCAQKNDDIRIVLGSKLSLVPKNEDTMRTIAIEPSGSMCLQLAAGTYLENTLRQIGLDIKKQEPKNKALACRGSIDDSLATIDLSSASDRISCDLVRALFPKEWYDVFMTFRSPAIRVNGEWVELNMMSTMGNGFTFPMMTLIIASLIYAMRRLSGGPNLFIDWSSTAVYGDDIIVYSHEYDDLVGILQDAGFIVNLDKSYSKGPFRESCGGDYMRGEDVTPFYAQSLATDSEIYTVINQLTLWASSRDFFPIRTLRLLYSYLRKGPYFVPMWSQPDSGIRSLRVRSRYKYLSPVNIANAYNGRYAMMLACGGYISDYGSGPFYMPSLEKTRYCTREARLPKGYLDGAEATSVVSEIRQLNINLMLVLV